MASAVHEAMVRNGFSRLEPFVYRYGDGAIRHQIWFYKRGSAQQNLTAVYGFGNVEADRFAIQALTRFGGHLYQQGMFKTLDEPPLKFDFGLIAGWGLPSAAIDLSVRSPKEVAIQLGASLEVFVQPNIQRLQSSRQLLEFLIRDDDQFGWALSNAATRALQIMFLGSVCNVPLDAVKEKVKPHTRRIKGQIDKGSDVERFLDGAASMLPHSS